MRCIHFPFTGLKYLLHVEIVNKETQQQVEKTKLQMKPILFFFVVVMSVKMSHISYSFRPLLVRFCLILDQDCRSV